MARSRAFITTGAALFLVFMTLASLPLAGQSIAQFNRLVDFSHSLISLTEMQENGESLPINKALILDGNVADITVIDPQRETFVVEIELVLSVWIGTSEIRDYTALVSFDGERFYPLFIGESPIVKLHEKILIAGVIDSIVEDEYDPIIKIAALQARSLI